MVDALHEVHRVLRPGGILVDARPTSGVSAIEHVAGRAARAVGTVSTSREAHGDDAASDRAIDRVKREGLFRSRRRGEFMHHVAFSGLPALQSFLNEHRRLVKRARWSVDRARRRRLRNDPFRVERPVRYELLERLSGDR